ncbi:hypothetical protein Barb7_03169 [Bacteroidales bacterium Barb7]|nr:hypothetical protein Barb7_03169 [Bacteroidales bacterium Barb7]
MFHLKLFMLLTVNHCANHIRRKQVRRKLDTAVLRINQRGERFNRQRFRQSRHSFQKDMPVRKQADQ